MLIPFAAAVAGRRPEPVPWPSVPHGVDHLVYAAPELDAGIAEIARLVGVRAAVGGRHPVFGTRNALLSLGPSTYLEIIAPDPALPRPAAGRLAELAPGERARLFTWVLRDEAIEARAGGGRARGVMLGAVQQGTREAPDGSMLRWRLTEPRALPLGGAVPFLIAWGDTPHPARTAPRAGDLVGLRVEHPDPDAVRAALGALDVTMRVDAGSRMRLVALIRTPAGVVQIS